MRALFDAQDEACILSPEKMTAATKGKPLVGCKSNVKLIKLLESMAGKHNVVQDVGRLYKQGDGNTELPWEVVAPQVLGVWGATLCQGEGKVAVFCSREVCGQSKRGVGCSKCTEGQ